MKPNRRGGRKFTTATPYFSRGRFTSTRSATPYVYTISAGQEIRLFGYAQGGDMGAAGRGSTNATNADTNLVTAGQTIGGEKLTVTGVSIQICSNTISPEMVAGIWDEISVKASTNGGSNAFLLGTPAMLPGGSGLYGAGSNYTGVQPITGGRPVFSFFSNGLPGNLNQGVIPEGFLWDRAGQTDSNLVILMKTERAFASNLSGTNASDKADVTAATGILAYLYPTAAEVFVDVRVRLYGVAEADRSANA